MAALFEAPLLLVPTSGTLPSSVAAELDRLQTQQIIVAGGPAAVSNSMVSQLAAHSANKKPYTIDGANRYDTADWASDMFDPPLTGVPVYIASGTTFPDALGGGAAAAIDGTALLLTTPTKLPSETVAALRRIKPTKVVLLGGTGAISNTVLSQVRSTVGSSVPVSRVGGANRFETAAKVSAATVPSASEVFLANGMDYPDALAGAPVSIYGPNNTVRPLLLTQTSCVPRVTLNEITRLGATKVTALGGTGAVSDAALSLKPC
jgi:putative cell wall-binding protein